ncbi:MAG: hypothetical protein ABIO44_07080 [Saprospiraceae bacterium]
MRLLLLFALFNVSIHNTFADFKLICPGDITVDCNIDYSNLNQFGNAYVDHNGSIIWVKDCKVSYDLNDCGYGIITRIWGVEDPDWKWVTCTQIITLSNANSFGDKDITWPKDITFESCDPEKDLKNLFKPYDRPYWKTNKCAKPMLNSSDTRFKVSEGCTKIVRLWRILDWCVFDPYNNPNAGIYSFIQVIKLITVDTAARISCPKDLVVDANVDCKGARVKLDLATVSSPCKMPYIIHNTSTYADTNTADASGFYPVGMHKFYYIAEYACGKELKCEITITVLPKIPPVPYCKVGVIVDLMPVDSDGDGTFDEGMIDVWAKDLDHGSYHPCGKQNLNFSFSSDVNDKSRRFTCKEIGENEVEIWVTDINGNQDHCITKIIIQNNIGIPNCKKFTSPKYDLNISLHHSLRNEMVEQATINSVDMNAHTTQLATNIGSGNYVFKDLINLNQQLLSFSLPESPKPNAEDFKWLSKYISGEIAHPTAYQILAADINNDALIDVEDIKLLKILTYQKKSKISNLYKIVPLDYPFSTSLDALKEYKQLNMIIPSHTESIMRKDYVAIPVGKFLETYSSISNFSNNAKNSSEQSNSISFDSENNTLNITSENEPVQLKEVRIWNSTGQLIFNKSLMIDSKVTVILDQNILNSGIYFVSISDKVQRFVLVK